MILTQSNSKSTRGTIIQNQFYILLRDCFGLFRKYDRNMSDLWRSFNLELYLLIVLVYKYSLICSCILFWNYLNYPTMYIERWIPRYQTNFCNQRVDNIVSNELKQYILQDTEFNSTSTVAMQKYSMNNTNKI